MAQKFIDSASEIENTDDWDCDPVKVAVEKGL